MSKVSKLLNVQTAIVAASGYTGRELARLLLNHPSANLQAVFARDTSWQLSDELPEQAASDVATIHIDEIAEHLSNLHTVFLATPPEVSIALAPSIIESGVNVIDLSGAFRLPQQQFTQWYQQQHNAPNYIDKACYGLAPWIELQQSQQAQLISNPGCYATAALMALLPLCQDKLIKPESIVIDAKSGISGAGKKADKALLYCECDNDFVPYKIGQHQHTPEISHYLQTLAQTDVMPVMTNSLLPIKRGICTSIYADVSHQGINITQLQASYEKAYGQYPLVNYYDISNQSVADAHKTISLKKAVGSCRTHIGFSVQNNKVIVFSMIDNLLKGAASQAIENFNQLIGYGYDHGLSQWEGLL